jgi:hypothetical protein
MQKSAGPARHGVVVPEPPFDMAMAGPGARFGQALAGQERPAAHNCKIHFRMELEAIGLPAISEGLSLKILPPSQEGCSAWQIEPFPVPLVDVVGEPAVADAVPVFRRMDRVIADLHSPLGVGTNAVTEMACEHLGTKTNAQKRRVFLQRDPDPVYLAAQPGVFVVDAHGTTKNDHTCVISKRFRQRIPEAGTPAIEFAALRAQDPPEPSGSRMFLMQDDEYPAATVGASWHHSQC